MPDDFYDDYFDQYYEEDDDFSEVYDEDYVLYKAMPKFYQTHLELCLGSNVPQIKSRVGRALGYLLIVQNYFNANFNKKNLSEKFDSLKELEGQVFSDLSRIVNDGISADDSNNFRIVNIGALTNENLSALQEISGNGRSLYAECLDILKGRRQNFFRKTLNKLAQYFK